MLIGTVIKGRHFPIGISCHVCLKYSTECKLLRCSNCRMIMYCSKEHQKQDWPEHKKMCRAVREVAEKRKYHFHCKLHTDKPDCHCTNMEMCEEILKRRLETEELHLFFNLLCKYCFSLWENLHSCPECNAIVYCSEEHKINDAERHMKVCKELKLMLDMNRALKKGVFVSGCIKKEDLLEHVPMDMESLLDKTKVAVVPDEFEPFGKNLLSDTLTLSATILYAIHKCKPLRKLSKKELTIHVVGANEKESCHASSWAFLCNMLDQLDVLHLVFIGPEINKHDMANAERFVTQDLDDCKKHCYIMESFKRCLYHDFIRENPDNVPDVIIAFNCGFHDRYESELWTDSIPSMCSFPEAIITFTSYNKQESELDLIWFDLHSGRDDLVHVVSSERNPFRSHLPLPEVKLDNGVYYNNNFISILYSE